jgi:hypothetical protein
MSPCEQGLLAFLLTTLFLMGTTLFFALKLDRAQRQINQFRQKSNQSEHRHDK